MGQIDQAAELVSANVDRLDSDGTLEVLLAEISLLRGDRETALANLKRAFEQSGFDPGQLDGAGGVKLVVEEYGMLLSDAGRHREAVAVLRPYVRAYPSASTSAVTALGASYLHSARIAEATALLRREVRGNPSSVKSWTLLAQASLVSDDLTTARRCVDQLAALAPDCSLTYLLRGFVDWRQGDLGAAENSLKSALAIDDEAVSHELYGRVLEDAGRSRALADSHFEQARRFDSLLVAPQVMIDSAANTHAVQDEQSTSQSASTSATDGARLP